jgi:glycosyltransferase involved in cell wall biosynthesis
MIHHKIVVVSGEGNPSDPRTWSGTPSNLIEGLRGIGCEVTGFNLLPDRPVRAVITALSLVAGFGKEYRRTPFFTMYSDMMAPKSLPPESAILHMGLCTIPHRRKVGDGRHAIYLDTTFNQISKYAIRAYSSAIHRKYEQFEIACLKAADHIFTVSECAMNDLINHYSISPGRVTSVGTGLGKIRPKTGDKDYSSRTVLFVAKQRFEDKGGMLLLEGFRLAQVEDPRLKLIVVATEPYRQVVEAIPGASFKSNLPWDELENLFNSASLFAMPALYEPWGLVYLEALACRTPILGLNRNAVPEFTQDGKFGFLIDEATGPAVANALSGAFADTEQLANMGRSAQLYVQGHYGWDKTAIRIDEALFPKST